MRQIWFARRTPTPEPVRLLAGSGLHLTADRWGHPDHPPVLLLHGAGQNRRSWDNTAHAVTQAGWHAITVDHRGHGDSDWPKAADYDFADDVLDFIDTLRPGS